MTKGTHEMTQIMRIYAQNIKILIYAKSLFELIFNYIFILLDVNICLHHCRILAST